MMNSRPVNPLSIEIKLTNKCNSNCLHCIANSTGKSEIHLNKKHLPSIVKKIKKANIFYIGLTGGEPLLYPHLFYFLELIKKEGFEVGITTNGLLIDRNLAKKLKQSGISLARISLDGDSPKLNDYFRGVKGHFNKVRQAVKYLNEVGVDSIILSVISRYNIDKLENIILTASDFGARGVNCYSLVPSGRAKNLSDYILSPKEYKQFLGKILKLKSKYRKKIKVLTETPLLNVLTKNSNHICLAGNASLFIKEDGSVIPCPYMDSYFIGNIIKYSISKIWNNKKLIKLTEKDGLSESCLKCDYSEGCFGGCRAAALSMHGRISEKDPFCWVK